MNNFSKSKQIVSTTYGSTAQLEFLHQVDGIASKSIRLFMMKMTLAKKEHGRVFFFITLSCFVCVCIYVIYIKWVKNKTICYLNNQVNK